MNHSGSNPYSSTNYHSVDCDTARTLINDITYKPSADEVAAMERREAEYQAAKAAKAARKADKKAKKASKGDSDAYNYYGADDKASVFSDRSTSTYAGSIRSLLSRKGKDSK